MNGKCSYHDQDTSRPAGFKTAKHSLSNTYHDPVTVLIDHVQYIHEQSTD